MELAPCPECARHVRTDAARCPFCDARPRELPKRPRVVAQVTRAMVFYAGAMTAACAEPAAPPEPVAPELVEVAPMAPVRLAAAEPAPEDPTPAAQPVAVDVEPEPRAVAAAERRHAEAQKHPRVIQHVIIDPWNGNCCPPYGAPPADTIV